MPNRLEPKSSKLEVHLNQLAKMRRAALEKKKPITVPEYNKKYGEGKKEVKPEVVGPKSEAEKKADTKRYEENKKKRRAAPAPAVPSPKPKPKAKPKVKPKRVAPPKRVANPAQEVSPPKRVNTGGRTKRIIMGPDGRPTGNYRYE